MEYEFLLTLWECVGCGCLYNNEQPKCDNCHNKLEKIKVKGVRA